MTDQLVRGIELAKEAVGAESARIEIYKELGDSPVTIGEDRAVCRWTVWAPVIPQTTR